MVRGLTIVVLAGVAVAAMAAPGYPVPVGVVETGSMAPTLEPGDRFLAVPPGLLDGVDVGDVVVFDAGDGWTVHRAVSETRTGFSTAGDANPLTDQADGAPPVPSAAVAGIVPSIAGRPAAVSLPDVRPAAGTIWVATGLVVAGMARAGGRVRPPRPGTLGAVVAAIVSAGWLLEGSAVAQATVEEVRNTGPIPMMVVETGPPAAAPLWPGEALEVSTGAEFASVIGWAPASALDAVAPLGATALVLVIATTTGLLTAFGAKLVLRTFRPVGTP